MLCPVDLPKGDTLWCLAYDFSWLDSSMSAHSATNVKAACTADCWLEISLGARKFAIVVLYIDVCNFLGELLT